MIFFRSPTIIALSCLSACAVSSVAKATDEQRTGRPNILFIYTDDHSHRTVGCYPEARSFVNTPNIDALADAGIRFRYAYIGTWCMPSRATLLTGHYQHGVESMRMEGPYPGSEYDPAKCPFWPSAFRKNGYQTAHIGKWHTGTDTGFDRDWDYQVVWNRPRHTGNAGNYYKDQVIEKNGGKGEMVKGYSTDNYTQWAVNYLNGEGRNADKPWYLWLCYGAVHGPFTPAQRHRNAYADARIPVPADIFPPRVGKPGYMQNAGSWFKGDDGLPHLLGRRRATGEVSPGIGIHGSDLNSWIRQYHQGVIALDEAVGRLVQALKETGQYDNTLIVFTSDQGFAWGQHGFRSKVAPYDATIRSPLIVSMPSRLPKGKVAQTPVGGVDLIPTFFSFAEIELPWTMHGRDLTPLLQSPAATWDRPLLMVHTGRDYGSDTVQIPTDESHLFRVAGIPWYASIHDGRYKYIRTFVKDEIEELYDLESDPEELSNLALQAEYVKRVNRMRVATVRELKRTGAGFADALPAVGN
ncbi:MAG: sulfatase-like hydrolase/transferase [Fuerstiella sp.]|nr:sulfatase-like hydrolase/transferase [Fuerstiella sp.]MCP4509818.1 sulfatase-like hydrolase/transferase [Fuerstiella sp.]